MGNHSTMVCYTFSDMSINNIQVDSEETSLVSQPDGLRLTNDTCETKC